MLNDPIYPAAVKPDPLPLPRQLVDQFVYQKNLALERAGVDLYARSPLTPDKAWTLYGDAMAKMAKIVESWQADPGVVMEACFAYARSKRHMDGPQLNMLGSEKYLTQAIAYHMELPRDAAVEMLSRDGILKRLAKEAATFEAAIRRHLLATYDSEDPNILMEEKTALEFSMFHSVPPLYRFLICTLSRPLGRLLIPEILETLRVNARQRLWAQHNGWSYRGMAYYYQMISPRKEEAP